MTGDRDRHDAWDRSPAQSAPHGRVRARGPGGVSGAAATVGLPRSPGAGELATGLLHSSGDRVLEGPVHRFGGVDYRAQSGRPALRPPAAAKSPDL
jgi:hypothetical protein